MPTLLLAGGDSPEILKTGIDLVPAVLARLATSTASPRDEGHGRGQDTE